jgi:cytoskeleton protein RodZ
MSLAEQPPRPRLGLGGDLAAARLERGLDLRDAERETKIRAHYLAALEEEDFDALPGEGYAAVFLRTYASYLGLDADVCADELRRRRGARAPRVGSVITRASRRRPRMLRRLGV